MTDDLVINWRHYTTIEETYSWVSDDGGLEVLIEGYADNWHYFACVWNDKTIVTKISGEALSAEEAQTIAQDWFNAKHD